MAVKIEHQPIMQQTIRRKDSRCMQPDPQNWLKNIPHERGYYFAGFTDGEGSFNVSLCWREDHKTQWKVTLTFNVSQRESYILAQFKQLLGCGRLQYRKDGVCYFVVSNPHSIVERVIPFFERFRFLSQTKQKNFRIFKEITKLVIDGKHLTEKGLKEIVTLRESLNEGRGRKRKYTQQDVLRSFTGKSSETNTLDTRQKSEDRVRSAWRHAVLETQPRALEREKQNKSS